MKAQQTELTLLAQQILSAMKDHGWLSRKQIAHLIGKDDTLRNYQLQQLVKLRNAGLIEERRSGHGPRHWRYYYRIVKHRLASQPQS